MRVLICDGCGRTKERVEKVSWWVNCSLQLGSDKLFSAVDLCSPCRATLLRVLKEALAEYWAAKDFIKAGPTCP